MNTQTKFTPGPWRWEMNMQSKVLHLVGGRPRYDLTIMDFTRWGMGNAVARLRDPAHDGMNLMHRLCDRKDWMAPFAGREHHANWCQDVTHPDMQLMAASPDLYAALEALTDFTEWSLARSELYAEEFRRETGMLAPFKDAGAMANEAEELHASRAEEWRAWCKRKRETLINNARTALKRARGEA